MEDIDSKQNTEQTVAKLDNIIKEINEIKEYLSSDVSYNSAPEEPKEYDELPDDIRALVSVNAGGPKNIQKIVDNDAWQKVRESMEGTSTAFKIKTLRKYLSGTSNTNKLKRVLNYLNALKRGGINSSDITSMINGVKAKLD